MDTVTHVLTAALWTEPLSSPAVQEGTFHPRWRDRAAVILGASIMDADGVLGWISQLVRGDMLLYTLYHRVVTHSVVGLLVCALVSALIARHWPERWLLPILRPDRSAGQPVTPRLQRLFGLASIAAGWHFVGDAITHWGTLKPLWPVLGFDVQWDLVNSLSPPLLGITLVAWAVQNQVLKAGHRRWAWAVVALWLATCLGFIVFRPLLIATPPFA